MSANLGEGEISQKVYIFGGAGALAGAVLGGAALVLAGLGAGYFFMHRGTSHVAEVPAAAASLPSGPG